MKYVLFALIFTPTFAFAHNGINHHAERFDLLLIVIASVLSIANAIRISRKEKTRLPGQSL